MSTKTIYICDYCDEEFKFLNQGGKMPTYVVDIFTVPPTHFRLTDTLGDVYDFCSKACNIMWLNGEK